MREKHLAQGQSTGLNPDGQRTNHYTTTLPTYEGWEIGKLGSIKDLSMTSTCLYQRNNYFLQFQIFAVLRIMVSPRKGKQPNLRFQHMSDSSSSSLKANTTAKEDGQDNVWKCSCKVHSLKIENIEPELKQSDTEMQ